MVLAASHMGEEDESANAYYARLAELIGPADTEGHPPFKGFAELCSTGFQTLADWLADDERGRRGQLYLDKATASRRHIGIPIGQAVLRAADIRWLGTFFRDRARHLDAGWDPAGTLLHHPARHQLTIPAREVLEAPERRPLLSAALTAARKAWDGSLIDVDGRRVVRSSLGAHLDPMAGTLHLSLRADGLTVDETAVAPDGYPIQVPAPPREMVVPNDWLERAREGAARVMLTERRSLHVLPGPLIMFVVGDGGFEQVPVATEPVWLLTCQSDIQGGELVDVELPAGWRLLAQVPVEALPPEQRAEDPTTANGPGALSVTAGLSLGDGGWLAERAPEVAGPQELTATLFVDGMAIGRLDRGLPIRLAALDDETGIHHLVAGDLSLDVQLEDSGSQRGYGEIAWRLDSPARTAAGPGLARDDDHSSLAGALIVDGTTPDLPSIGPWTRATALVWALLRDGSVVPVNPPDLDSWIRSVGVQRGSAWPLPQGTIWACQPSRKTVTLVEPEPVEIPAREGAGRCVQFLSDAQVVDAVGSGDAPERWQAVIDACREANLV